MSFAVLLLGTIRIVPAYAASTRTTIVRYHTSITSAHWYQRILLPPLLFLLGRNWKTMSIATTFVQDGSGQERVAEVNAWPNDVKTTKPDPDEIAFRLADSPTTEGFLWFLKRTKFRDVQVPQLLALYTYLYNDDREPKTFDTTNLFEKKDGSMHCLFSKDAAPSGNAILIKTLNASKQVNGQVKIMMSPHPVREIVEIHAKLKIGILVTLIRMDQ